MAESVFNCERVLTPAGVIGSSSVSSADGRISAISPVDLSAGDWLPGDVIVPGFVDIHDHGAVGVDVNLADADGLIEVGRFLASSGVAAWMPTLVPDTPETYERVVEAIDEVMGRQDDLPVAQVIGVHYEGVFANEAMCGALRPQYFLPAEPGAAAKLPRLRRGLHLTTVAPEIDGGIELISELAASGWTVAIGHTKATRDKLDAAFTAGARHLTHFFNAMTGIHHRDLGVAGWGLAGDATFDIIADGMHVDLKMLELAIRAKGCERVSLISDSIAPTGSGDGDYRLWGETVSVRGKTTKNDRGSIAGSVITVADAVETVCRCGFDPADAARMAAFNPAEVVGAAGIGRLEIGSRTDLVGLDRNGKVVSIVVGGERIK